ncbi:hypothetical protein CCACVL1_31074 [Corchorus capsularis]|uniref:glutamine synthetase n=1 Tax=Corchorus capsularis TaxID=210143 RepID=A0A1R3FU80_COCAP|nr:hypothetical protein CCACVL1_31074 [Corchorus capsularis]
MLSRRFLWGGSEGKKALHLVHWDDVCKPKVYGGLGLQKMEYHNRVLLQKTAWRFLTQPSSLWVQCILVKYRIHGDIFDFIKGAGSKKLIWSSSWRGLASALLELSGSLRKRVGSGVSVKFWTDTWLDQLIADSLEVLPSFVDPNVLVKDFIMSNGAWNADLLFAQLPYDIATQILGYPLPTVVNLDDSYVFADMSLLSDLVNLNLSESTEKVIAEYIWIGGSGMDLRSKARTLPTPVSDPKKLPKWNYDGSSTGQAPGEDSEVILYPQAIFKDPFRRGNNILVMCDAYTPAGEPIPTNKRCNAEKIFSHPDVVAEEPWYGIEQEYTLLQKDVKWPIGWPTGGYPGPQGPYYCGVGADKAFGRDIVNSHYKACLYAGINISGINGEVMPGQWEFQVGPAVGISAGDELWVARYILERITEIAGVILSFDPKPIQGDWNGAGAHTNYR